jgi:hypothetical protein
VLGACRYVTDASVRAEDIISPEQAAEHLRDECHQSSLLELRGLLAYQLLKVCIQYSRRSREFVVRSCFLKP